MQPAEKDLQQGEPKQNFADFVAGQARATILGPLQIKAVGAAFSPDEVAVIQRYADLAAVAAKKEVESMVVKTPLLSLDHALNRTYSEKLRTNPADSRNCNV